jgi:hypothetical protein
MVSSYLCHFVTWRDAGVIGGVGVLDPDFLSISSSCAASN